MDAVGEPLGARGAELLTSLDNRRFFQGVAELTVAALLERGKFQVEEVDPDGDWIALRKLGGGSWDLLVEAFIHRSRDETHRASAARLLTALERTGGSQCLLVGIERPLPASLDTEEVRQAVDNWMADVEHGRRQGRYAAFHDAEKGIHLEFGLTGRPVRSGPRVCGVLGPHVASSCIPAVERRLLDDLERSSRGPRTERPLLVACVGDRPWPVSPGYLRDFLYGRARTMAMTRDGERHALEAEYDTSPDPSLFRDARARDLSGLLWVGRDPSDPSRAHCTVHLNPWARVVLDAGAFPFVPVFAPERETDSGVAMRWHQRAGPHVRIL